LDPRGLRAFCKSRAELIVDIGSLHEIVPISFTPVGSVQRLYLFDDFAIDQESGKRYSKLDLEALKGKKFTNGLTREMIVVSPEPGGLLPK
jgi:hypothetical protein